MDGRLQEVMQEKADPYTDYLTKPITPAVVKQLQESSLRTSRLYEQSKDAPATPLTMMTEAYNEVSALFCTTVLVKHGPQHVNPHVTHLTTFPTQSCV